MDVRQITETYFVAPQIDPSAMTALADAGFTAVIDNRPDLEIPPSHHASVMQSAAEAAGLSFVYLPITHDTMTPDALSAQRDAIGAAGGKVLAYCASGTRCTVIWAMAEARDGEMSVDAILAAAAEGGYQLSQLRPQLASLSEG